MCRGQRHGLPVLPAPAAELLLCLLSQDTLPLGPQGFPLLSHSQAFTPPPSRMFSSVLRCHHLELRSPHQSPHLVTTPDFGSNLFLFLPSSLVSLLLAGRGFTLVVRPFLSPSPFPTALHTPVSQSPRASLSSPDTRFRQPRLQFSALACLLSQPELTTAPGSRTACSVPQALAAPGVQVSSLPPIHSDGWCLKERLACSGCHLMLRSAFALVPSGVQVTSVTVGPEVAARWVVGQLGTRPVPNSSLCCQFPPRVWGEA